MLFKKNEKDIKEILTKLNKRGGKPKIVSIQ